MFSRAPNQRQQAGSAAPRRTTRPSGQRKRIPTLSGLQDPELVSSVRRDQPLLTVLSGPQLGMVVPVTSHLVLGRSEDADVRFDEPTVSWRHARVDVRDGSVSIQDLGSTNGTFISGRRIDGLQMLADGDRISLGSRVELKLGFHDELEARASLALYESAVHDALTGVYNRRYLEDRLHAEFSFAARNSTALSVLMIDIDHFKRVNDEHGHGVGDALLRVVASSIRRLVRPEDVVARYGGEEFVVIARSISARNAVILAERTRKQIHHLPLPADLELPPLTVSIGVATMDDTRAFEAPELLLAAADGAMYAAKRHGRDRVVAG